MTKHELETIILFCPILSLQKMSVSVCGSKSLFAFLNRSASNTNLFFHRVISPYCI